MGTTILQAGELHRLFVDHAYLLKSMEHATPQLAPGTAVEGEVLSIHPTARGTRIALLAETHESSRYTEVAVYYDPPEDTPALPDGVAEGHLVRITGVPQLFVRNHTIEIQLRATNIAARRGKSPRVKRLDDAYARLPDPPNRDRNPLSIWGREEVVRKVGVVCRPGTRGANDMIQPLEANNKNKKNEKIEFRLFPVEDLACAEDIARAIREATAAENDVILVGRGGGDAPSLLVFDDPSIATALHEATLARRTTIVGVGHSDDRPRAAHYASDSAHTPHEAADWVGRRNRQLERKRKWKALEEDARDARQRAAEESARAVSAERNRAAAQHSEEETRERLARTASSLRRWRLGCKAAMVAIGVLLASLAFMLARTGGTDTPVLATAAPSPTELPSMRAPTLRHGKQRRGSGLSDGRRSGEHVAAGADDSPP